MEIDLTNFLVIDIETVAGASDYNELTPRMQTLWDQKSRFFKEADHYMVFVKMFSQLYSPYPNFLSAATL